MDATICRYIVDSAHYVCVGTHSSIYLYNALVYMHKHGVDYEYHIVYVVHTYAAIHIYIYIHTFELI